MDQPTARVVQAMVSCGDDKLSPISHEVTKLPGESLLKKYACCADMSGGQAASGYNGGAGTGGAYGGGAGYGGGQGVASAYGGNAGYGANAAAAYGDGSAGYGQQGSYGRAAPGRGSMGHARYRPY